MILSDLTLAQRLEAGEALVGVECAQAQMRLRPDSGTAIEAVGSGYAIFAGIGSPLTHVLGLGMHGPVSLSELEKVEIFYHSRGSAVHIELCPLANPSLLDLLGRSGYRLAEFNTVLICPLDRPKSVHLHASKVEVRQTSPIDSILWANTVAAGFFEGEAITSKILGDLETIFSACICSLAWLNGEPAGGAALSIHNRLAMFVGDSTLPSYRRQGVQSAQILARCAWARDLDSDMAVASTLPGSTSQRNYEKAGFQPVYTKAILIRDWA